MWKPALNRVAASTAAANLAAKTFHTYADLLPEDDETFAVAYTDLFEASVFGSDGGPIRALVKRAMDGASSLLPAPARA